MCLGLACGCTFSAVILTAHLSDCRQAAEMGSLGWMLLSSPLPACKFGVNPGDFLHLLHQWCIAESGSVPWVLAELINISKAL